MGQIETELLQLPKKIVEECSKIVVGKESLIEDLLSAMLAEGHVLVEGVPGIAKTTVVKTFAKSLGLSYKRVQCTPDLLPADIIGTYVYDQRSGDFKLMRGPVFCNVLLVDEINRNTPKSQSAVLEAMQERQVTIEGTTLPLDRPFILLATRNPIEIHGVFDLPEAQLDRFLLSVKLDYPTKEDERVVLDRIYGIDMGKVETVASHRQILDLIQMGRNVFVKDEVRDYMVEIVRATREHPDVRLGGSPRASIAIYKVSKAMALVKGRAFVIPDDVKFVARSALRHRLILTADAEIEERSPEDIITSILERVPVPKVQ